MSASLLNPSHIVSMVEEGEDMAMFRLCNCSSTLFLLEQGLEGTLTDLKWDAMAVMELKFFFLLWKWKRIEAVLQWCRALAKTCPYIYKYLRKDAEAMA